MKTIKEIYSSASKKPLLEVQRENLDYKKYIIKKTGYCDFIVGNPEYGMDYNKRNKNTITFLEDILSIVDFSNVSGDDLTWEKAKECIDLKRLKKLHDKYGWIVDIKQLFNKPQDNNIHDNIENDPIMKIRITDIYKRIILLSLLEKIVIGIKDNNVGKIDAYSSLLFKYFNPDDPMHENYFNTDTFVKEILSVVNLSNVAYNNLTLEEAEKSIDYNRLKNLRDKYSHIFDDKHLFNYAQDNHVRSNYENYPIIRMRITDKYKPVITLYLIENIGLGIKDNNLNKAQVYSNFLFKYFNIDDYVSDSDEEEELKEDLYPLHLILKENCAQHAECKKIYDSCSIELQKIIDELEAKYKNIEMIDKDDIYRIVDVNKDRLEKKILDLINSNHPFLEKAYKEKIQLYFSKYYKYHALISVVQGYDDFISRYQQLNDIDKTKVLKPYIEKIIDKELENIKWKFSVDGGIYYQCDDAISTAYFNFSQLMSDLEMGIINVKQCPYCNLGIIIGNKNKKSCNFCNRKTRYQRKRKAIKQDFKNGMTYEALLEKYCEGNTETKPETIKRIISEVDNE